MTLFAQSDGTRNTVAKRLTTNTALTLVGPVKDGGRIILDSVLVSCNSTPTAFSLWITDGTTDFYLIQAKGVSANDVLSLTNHHVMLRPGWSLKCQAASANNLHATVVTLESGASKGGQQQTR